MTQKLKIKVKETIEEKRPLNDVWLKGKQIIIVKTKNDSPFTVDDWRNMP